MKINNKKSTDRKSTILIICFLSCIAMITFLWTLSNFLLMFFPFLLIIIIVISFSKLRYLEFEINEYEMKIKSSDPLIQFFFKSSRMKYYEQIVTAYRLKGRNFIVEVNHPKKIGGSRARFNLDYMDSDEWQSFYFELIEFPRKKTWN